ncbi:MAG: hypothetical protein ACI9N1_000321 [Flavobacteriales bacterium]|jgi:hypothetical protein
MKKNFKNVAFVLGMIAISTAAMTSCGAAEKAKDAAADNADKVEAAGEVVKENGKEVAPAVTHDAIETNVNNVVEMVEGDSTAKCGDTAADTTAKCGEEGAH